VIDICVAFYKSGAYGYSYTSDCHCYYKWDNIGKSIVFY